MIICDIDGTLADTSLRAIKAFGPTGKANNPTEHDWNVFFNPGDMLKDKVISYSREVLEDLNKTQHIIMLTGRRVDRKKPTEVWLKQNGIPYHRLIMRAPQYYKLSNSDFKKEIILPLIGANEDWGTTFIDDEPANLDMAKELGCKTREAPGCWETMYNEMALDAS